VLHRDVFPRNWLRRSENDLDPLAPVELKITDFERGTTRNEILSAGGNWELEYRGELDRVRHVLGVHSI